MRQEDGASHHTTKVVSHSVRRIGVVRRIRTSKVSLIKLVGSSVNGIGARFECCRNNSAAGASAISRRNASLDLEFPDSISVRKYRNLPELRFVIVNSVKGEIIICRTSSISRDYRPARFAKSRRLSRIAWTARNEVSATSKRSDGWSCYAG